MEVNDLLLDVFERITEHVHEAVDGLDVEALTTAPEPGTNPIGWLVWHATRVQDDHIAELLEVEQVWISGDWASRFGVAADPDNTGYAHSWNDVSAIRPESAATLIEYYDAVAARTRELLAEDDRERSRPRRRHPLGSSGDARRAPDQHLRRRHPTHRPGGLRARPPRPSLKNAEGVFGAQSGWRQTLHCLDVGSIALAVMSRPHVVIIGSGFGGIRAAKGLARSPVDVTIIDANNFHTFQPLLYQVATAGLDADDIGFPIRGIFRRNRSIRFVLGEVDGINLHHHTVRVGDGRTFEYDYLVIAAGSISTSFGIDGVDRHTFALKTMHDALGVARPSARAVSSAPARRAAPRSISGSSSSAVARPESRWQEDFGN